MLASEIIADVRTQLLEPVAGFWTDAELLRHINRGEMDFFDETRSLEDTASLPLVAGQNDYPVPANFLSSAQIFYRDDTEEPTRWKPLVPSDMQEISRTDKDVLSTAAADQGKPEKFWLWGDVIYIDPTPSAEFTTELKMFYKATPIPVTTVDAPLNVDDDLADGITAFVLWKAWLKEKEMDLAKDQEARYREFIGRGRRKLKLKAMNRNNSISLLDGRPFNTGVTRPAGW